MGEMITAKEAIDNLARSLTILRKEMQKQSGNNTRVSGYGKLFIMMNVVIQYILVVLKQKKKLLRNVKKLQRQVKREFLGIKKLAVEWRNNGNVHR